MKSKFEKYDRVYLIVSNLYVREARVLHSSGGFVTILFSENLNGTDAPSGTRIRESRLYASKTEAEAALHKIIESRKKHGYWIHEKIPNDSSVTGYYYKRECTCSECGHLVNMEKIICPYCNAIMDKKAEN